jgi:basic membrane protein A
MKSKKTWLILILVLVLLGACGTTDEQEDDTSAAAEPVKVALILSGPINDGAWNAAAYNGVAPLKDKYNLQFEYSESVPQPDNERAFRGYAEREFDIIIGHGFGYCDAAVAVASEFPESKYAVVMGYCEGENIQSLNFKNEETGYLAGYVAAKMTKTGKIGGIGGDEIPSIIKMMEGYKLGARSVNPDIEIVVTYVGTWTDPTAGYEAALAQINQGVDVLFPVANLTSSGAYEAGGEKGVYVIGSEGDHCGHESGAIVASDLQHIGRVLEILIEDVADDTFQGGLAYYGLKEQANDVLACELPADVEAGLDELRQQIAEGEIEVPVILESTD